MQSPERVEAKSEQSRRLLERAKRRRRIVPPSTSCGLNQAALGTRVKNPGVAESSSWFRSTHLLRSIPLRCRLVTRSRLARLSDPEPGRKRRASAWSYVIFPFGSQPATRCLGPFCYFAACARYIPCTAAHSYFRVVRTGCNPRIISNRVLAPTTRISSRPSRRSGCAILARRPRRRRRRRWRGRVFLLVSKCDVIH